MTQENLKLLLVDLCARLPYGVKIYNGGIGKTVDSITIKPDYIEIVIEGTYAYSHFIHKDTGEWDNYDDLARCKPYLRPMSSMTEEERNEYKHFVAFSGNPTGSANFVDWLNEHHFDYRTTYDESKEKWVSMIEKGLALKAPEGMYK